MLRGSNAAERGTISEIIETLGLDRGVSGPGASSRSDYFDSMAATPGAT
jgi:hypothetical protein